MRPSMAAILALTALTLVSLASGNADAKRLGGGKTSGIAKAETSAAKAAPTASPAPKPASSAGKVAAAAVVGAGAGAVVGTAYARATSQPATPVAPQEQLAAVSPGVAASESRLRKLDEEAAGDKTDKPAVKSAAERRREQKEAAEKAAAERKAELQRAQIAREMSCQIKPVMTDAELANCREVWR